MAFLYNIQGGQLVLIIVVLLVLFGTKRLPEIAKSLGKAVSEFRRAAADISVQVAEPQPETKQAVAASTLSPSAPSGPISSPCQPEPVGASSSPNAHPSTTAKA